MTHRRRAFSLVELITVIGIITILIALLMPAMVRARAAAKSLVCQSNLRQIYQASAARVLEHRGYAQVAGMMHIPVTDPAGLGDPDEKRYAYFDDQGVRRPAPLQAALAPYLGAKIRMDSAANILADFDTTVLRKIFSCPSQDAPQPGIEIAGDEQWFGPRVPTSYAYNEGIFGWYGADHWMRGNMAKARPSADMVFMSDAVPRTDFGPGFIAWMPVREGRSTLADAYTNDNGTYKIGVQSQFDLFRHHYRMNVVFADGHVETLSISVKDLSRGVLLPE